jgi:hypothetical protein
MTRARVVLILAVAAALAVAGCGGGPKYVTVSGVVTVDNQPYPNAVVSFQPVAGKDGTSPGRGSSGVTDGEGRYRLVTDDGTEGAIPGKNRVRIQTLRKGGETFVDPQLGSPDNAGETAVRKGPVDPIPTEWYSDKGHKEFDVPPGGTDQANFSITSIHAGKKK